MPTDSTLTTKATPINKHHTNAVDDCNPSDVESDHCEDEGNGHHLEISNTESKN